MSDAGNTRASGSKAGVKKTGEKKTPVVKSGKNIKNPGRDAAVPLVLDRLLWLLSFALIIGAIGGNYYYTQYYIFDEGTLGRLVRTIVVIAVIVAGLGVVLFTNKGRTLISFAGQAYIELRKVVWPTRPEAVQTTFIVFVAVCLVSLFLYLCDLLVLQVVRAITM